MYLRTTTHEKPTYMTYYSPQAKPGWPTLALIVMATALAAGLGSVASLQAPEFYLQLDKPSWAPPAWLFGPVWTVLYIMMAAAAWLVVRQQRRASITPELALFAVQLALNALWTWLFFYWHQGALAIAEIVLLLCFVAMTAIAFARVRPLAGLLMLPYLAWVSFAGALTVSLWLRNPTLL